MNKFVSYLNSLNNANGSNENALAESQLLNDYYDSIVIDRKITDYIYNLLFNKDNNIPLVLTGHAGDGKTSILIQILKKAGYFNNGLKALKEVDEFDSKLLYIKDMSELNESKQEDMFLNFIMAPENKESSILISNTGPLINTTKRLLEKEYSKDEIEDFEINLLSQIDEIESSEIIIKLKDKEYLFKVINIAKIDNTYFVGEIIRKLTQINLWKSCELCSCNEKCPVYNNFKTIYNNQERIIEFVERLYIWFSDNQQRLTIRQMMSHLSYAISGNLDCNDINKKIIKDYDNLFNYHFANLFFGHVGTTFDKNSFNIKTIRMLNEQMFEEKALIEEDYKLFVQEDYSIFDEKTSKILENTIRNNYESLGIKNKESIMMRRSFRRFYMLLSKVDEEEFNNILKQVFSEVFPLYYELICEPITKKCIRTRNRVKDIVFSGLYRYLIGVYSNSSDQLYLTLKKENMDFQSVQLVLGSVSKNDIKLEQEKIIGNIENSDKRNKIIIKFGSVNFELTYQTLDYLYNISEGKVYTKLNPSFTFDLTKLKSQLIKAYGKKDEDYTTIRILAILNNNVKEIMLDFDDEILFEV